MSILRNLKPFVTPSTLASIGETLVSSTILYGAPIWSQTTEKNLDIIQNMQTKIARLVAHTGGWGSNRSREHRQELFQRLNWRNVRQLVYCANLNLAKQAIEHKTAHSLITSFSPTIPIRPRGQMCTRLDFNGKSARACTNYFVQTAHHFNNLPDQIRSPLNTCKVFKQKLREHVLSLFHLTHHNNHSDKKWTIHI